MVGLFFFIRASVKDRTQQIKLTAPLSKTSLFEQLQTYFTQRAYDITSIDAQRENMTLEGFVRPSWFMAIFLSILAALGLLCFGLVLSLIYPPLTPLFLGLSILSPLAGLFYWKQAGRIEKICLTLESISEPTAQQNSAVIVTAHRDELIQLQQALSLTPVNSLNA